jgi:PTS system nitrogen regulatory IIA component
MLLTHLLTPDRVRVPLVATDKRGVLRELAELMARQTGGQVAELLRSVEEREQVLSTGIGFGVAIPHGRSPAAPDLAAVAGRSAVPVAFDALDGEPVSLFFMLVGPERCAGEHVKALSRIARLARNVGLRQRLMSAPDGAAFFHALADAESR